MLHKLLTLIDQKLAFTPASAHCVIPCKIYDPITAQLAVLTCIRLIDLINDLQNKSPLSLSDHATLTRLVGEKETHAADVKDAIRVIWGDYFKPPQIEQYPKLHVLTHDIMMQASKVKQHGLRDDATRLLTLVNEFAAIFWESKGVATFTAGCPYPPSEPVVYPKLNGQ